MRGPSQTATLIPLITIGLIAVTALLWGFYQFHYSIESNNAVMVLFARRMLEGGTIGTAFYDTNPPLSIAIYLPVALAEKLWHLPVWYGITLYSLILSLCSAGLCRAILSRYPYISKTEATIWAVFFFLAGGFISHIFFGERDFLILLGVVPLILAQWALNKGYALPRPLLYTALLFGALLVLIKPHYGLLPFLLVMMRLRSPRRVFKPDLFVLGFMTLLYGLALVTIFQPFLATILPDALNLYVRLSPGSLPLGRELLIVLALGAAMAFVPVRQKEQKQMLYLLAALNGALFIAYASQLKGLYYHLLPLRIGEALILFTALLFALPPHRHLILLLAATGALLLVYQPKATYPSHHAYQTLPVGQILAECDQAPCSFLMSAEYTYIAAETALYHDAVFASRFPSFWFMPPLSCQFAVYQSLPPEVQKDTARLYRKYAAMVTEDLITYQPELVLIDQSKTICPDGREIAGDLVSFMEVYPPFRTVWQDYQKTRRAEINRRPYFTGTSADFDYSMYFDVYHRKGE